LLDFVCTFTLKVMMGKYSVRFGIFAGWSWLSEGAGERWNGGTVDWSGVLGTISINLTELISEI
jgi:hypothetical protein